jgi:hypothetical protein
LTNAAGVISSCLRISVISCRKHQNFWLIRAINEYIKFIITVTILPKNKNKKDPQAKGDKSKTKEYQLSG